MGKRKYEEVKGYWVYSIKVPSINKYYIGISKRKKCCDRWIKTRYVGTALEQYFDEWQSMEKTVLVDNLNKQESFIYEDNIIRALSMNNLCINERRSGLIYASDKNGYEREYREDNREKYNEYHRQWSKDNREKKNKYQRKYRLKKKLEKQQQTVVD